jgi:hypothetical protein
MAFVKKSVKRHSIQEDGPLTGKYMGVKEKEIKDQNTGELKLVKEYAFEVDGQKTVFLGDAGVNSAMFDAEPKVNDTIRITHTGKKDLDGGRRVNTYDVEIDDGKK